ncbi:hypothetical protein KHS38_21130 [Mucilaginibacter sp. Bleaf8]|uniref:hypothetical protein n=1 Tax=Mucilaginibacter sp. Bleaf8 TaxID=2834430 RepID=UPI001BCFA122|nr:hypothetical protein [Mucilaginibacter sp. Bleaf8]MBS7566922.1 hypothetical protein [Mucilaginibacter sp. Bleaf8]
MIFTSELLQQLEKDGSLKRAYAGEGSLGQNRWIILPMVVGAISAFGAYCFYDMAKTDSSYSPLMWACAALLLICLIAVALIQRGAKKKALAGNLDNVNVCIAKRIAGNEQAEVYYGIYTTGNKRHDAAFIEAVADKIYHIHDEQDLAVKRRIAELFSPALMSTYVAPTLLPVQFTFGENVYHKEFKFTDVDSSMKQYITENDGRFILLSYDNVSVPVLRSLPDNL